MSTDTTKRLIFIDALRGITMILVVYHHIVHQCFPRTFIDEGLEFIRMPMFFFISGFIAYKDLCFWTTTNTRARLLNKFRVQVVPTIIFYSIYFYFVADCNPFTLFLNHGWGRYWFTIVLFELFFIYFTTNFLTRKSSKLNLIAIIVIILFDIIIFHSIPKDGKLSVLIDFYGITSFLPFFLLGTLTRRYFNNVKRWIVNWKLLATLFCMFLFQLSITYLYNKHEIILLPQKAFNFINCWPMRIIGIMVVFGIFVRYRENFTLDKAITRTLSFVGRRTLDVYLLHFFFTKHVPAIHNYIERLNIGQWELVILTLFTALVVACCLVISETIKKWKFAGKLLFAAKY